MVSLAAMLTVTNALSCFSDFQARWKAFSIKLDEYLSSRQEHMQTLSR